MANEYVSKVVLSNGTTLIDLTGDTVTASDLLTGVTAHDKSGAQTTAALLARSVQKQGSTPFRRVTTMVAARSALHPQNRLKSSLPISDRA